MINLIIEEIILESIISNKLKISPKDIIKDHNFKQIYLNIIECRNCKCQIILYSRGGIRYIHDGRNITTEKDVLTCNEIIIQQIIE